jgi:hypothetical protein
MTVGPDGNIWFAEANSSGVSGKIGKITTAGTITEYQMPTTITRGGPGILRPALVTPGPGDGKLWFIGVGDLGGGNGDSSISSISTDGSTITTYGSNNFFGYTQYGFINGITAGPDGNMWATYSYTNFGSSTAAGVLKLSTTGVVLQNIPVSPNSEPRMIIVGPNHNLWFVEHNGNAIGTVTTSGTLHEYPTNLPSGYVPYTLLADRTSVYFTAVNSGQSTGVLARMSTSGQSMGVFSVPYGGVTPWISFAYGSGSGPNPNAFWLLDSGITIFTGTTQTRYAVPDPNPWVSPTGVVMGPDNQLWYADRNQNEIVAFDTLY